MSKTRKQRGMKPAGVHFHTVQTDANDRAVIKAVVDRMFSDWDRAIANEDTRPKRPWEKQ
jgi:hypothetical protein